MNTRQYTRWLPALLVAGVLVAPLALAQMPHPGHGGPRMKEMDSNGDGTVTKAEADAMHRRHVEQMDADHDGFVSFDEMRAFREAQREQRARERFGRLDRDGDGKVSTAELDAMADQRFARLDANGDGKVTRDEFRAHHRRGGRGPEQHD